MSNKTNMSETVISSLKKIKAEKSVINELQNLLRKNEFCVYKKTKLRNLLRKVIDGAGLKINLCEIKDYQLEKSGLPKTDENKIIECSVIEWNDKYGSFSTVDRYVIVNNEIKKTLLKAIAVIEGKKDKPKIKADPVTKKKVTVQTLLEKYRDDENIKSRLKTCEKICDEAYNICSEWVSENWHRPINNIVDNFVNYGADKNEIDFVLNGIDDGDYIAKICYKEIKQACLTAQKSNIW